MYICIGLENSSLEFYANCNGASLEPSDRLREAFLSCSRIQSITLEELKVFYLNTYINAYNFVTVAK